MLTYADICWHMLTGRWCSRTWGLVQVLNLLLALPDQKYKYWRRRGGVQAPAYSFHATRLPARISSTANFCSTRKARTSCLASARPPRSPSLKRCVCWHVCWRMTSCRCFSSCWHALLEKEMPEVYQELLTNVEKLERHFGDMQVPNKYTQIHTNYI